MGCHFLLQGIFPTQELNLGLPHCSQILYGLVYDGPGANLTPVPVELAVSSVKTVISSDVTVLTARMAALLKQSMIWGNHLLYMLFLLSSPFSILV